MTTVPELQAENDHPALIRKMQRVVAFMAPHSATFPESITDVDGELQPAPVGYFPLGLATIEGFSFTNEMEKEDVESLGYASPTRSDITKVTRQVTVTLQQYGRREILEIMYGLDLSAIEQSTGGEIVFDEVDLPIGSEYRLIVIGDDGPAASNWLLGKGFPRVKLASLGETSWAREGELQTPLTLDVFTDQEIGTPVRHYIAGTGAKAAADILGFGNGS